jgi:transposase InsO family protein
LATVRERVLRLGSRVRFQDAEHRVVAMDGITVTLQDPDGRPVAVLLAYLLSSDGFELLDGPARVSLGASGLVDGLSDEEQRKARWWEGHLLEVETGRHPDPKHPTRPGYDPSLPLADRQRAKVSELRGQGHDVSFRSVERMRSRYRAAGLWGLVDKRGFKITKAVPDVDQRVLDAALEIIAEQRDGSTTTTTKSNSIDTLADRLDQRYGDRAPILPSRATLYRLFAALDNNGTSWGPSIQRRRRANRPHRPFVTRTVTRPGELVEIDTNTFDVLVRFPDGKARRPELTMAVDVATRTILAGVFSPTAKAVDASALLARMVVPEPMRHGWPQIVHASRSSLPYDRLADIDERLRAAAARPPIVPEAITCDRGRIYLSAAFESACASLGISLQPARPYTPTDKPVVERTFDSIRTLFSQYVVGYVGSNVTERGSDLEDQPLFTMNQIQALFDEWLVLHWQNRPHEGLSNTWADGKPLTPNDMFAAMVGRAGYVPLALSADNYCDLLPRKWCVINDYGINHNKRVYDAAELNPHRREPSGVPGKGNQWEVRYDPYDISHVHVRNHFTGEWMTVPWTRAGMLDQPMTEAIYAYAAKLAAANAVDDRQPNESDIAREVRKLRNRARAGDATSAEQRLVARDATRPVRPPGPAPRPEPEVDAVDLDSDTFSDDTDARPRRTRWDLNAPLTPFDPRAEEWQ